jgi:hypothetical protein
MTAFLRSLGVISSDSRDVSDPGDCEGVGPKHDAVETPYSHLRPNLQAVSVSNIVHNESNSIFVRIPCTESTIWDCAVASPFRFTTSSTSFLGNHRTALGAHVSDRVRRNLCYRKCLCELMVERVCGAVANLRREMLCKGGWVPQNSGLQLRDLRTLIGTACGLLNVMVDQAGAVELVNRSQHDSERSIKDIYYSL